MRQTICLLLVLCGLSGMAQDLDFPDFRNKKDNFAKISDKDMRADVASFALAAVDESIGKAPLAAVPVVDYGPNFIKYSDDNIQVTIKTGIFFQSRHKLMMQEGHLLRIDGKPYYGGVIGEPPHTTIESITVLVGKDTVAIPPTAFFDLYDPKFSFRENGATRSRNGVFLSGDKHTFYIYLLNIDNKGTEYTFVIRNKQYLRRIVDWGFLN
ncbi:hypothetical protein [Puia dinghuensis]|uniref:DUF4251 domain-containing protein n=1 Tax=Puia dinghuensis TaxID=1792502 RepID=A0A8J2UDG7_9BACT|nr:hypothetical protein [Puia dinghuensis]GGB01207.1 hypothetical protein GCM10011511_25650 [Puia dinghuensis]